MCPLFKGGGDLCGFERNGWQPMPQPLIIDSGAAETVMPLSWFEGHTVKATEQSRNKRFYTTANKEKIYNEGERDLVVSSFEGDKTRKMTFQVAKVSKALGSVSQIIAKGNKMVFQKDSQGNDCSYIEHVDSGEVMWLRERDGVYVLDVLVAPPEYKPDDQGNQDFARRGR